MVFFPLEKIHLLYDGYQKAFQVGRLNLLLIQSDGTPYLIENRCPHMDVALTTATQLPGNKLRCRAHGIEFELESGRPQGPLANTLDCLKKYPISFDGNVLGIELDAN
ncbi:Rieske (2Fe-2S) protein [Teredinibacter waterburyi]|jgi:Ferredoxin subunits of nitrite reductase and ring-hydroxylating dioxygenases|uniref:Rieske (2Fe-2S) protein n=1 Tax=Teredinibacter waterburyi TaxID=1500538 RepID=UPI00165F186C|nr:Rieske (2Fe-2S) protein [Teredinibacter waterburyi]